MPRNLINLYHFLRIQNEAYSEPTQFKTHRAKMLLSKGGKAAEEAEPSGSIAITAGLGLLQLDLEVRLFALECFFLVKVFRQGRDVTFTSSYNILYMRFDLCDIVLFVNSVQAWQLEAEVLGV